MRLHFKFVQFKSDYVRLGLSENGVDRTAWTCDGMDPILYVACIRIGIRDRMGKGTRLKVQFMTFLELRIGFQPGSG